MNKIAADYFEDFIPNFNRSCCEVNLQKNDPFDARLLLHFKK